MTRALAVAPLALALHGFHSHITPLSAPVRAELRNHGFWHKGCPVALSDLRVLAVTIHGWDGRRHTGRLVTNRVAAPRLAIVFRKLYGLHFPIHHMTLAGVYGRRSQQFADPSGSFECRQAVPSPCVGGNANGNWSMHAFGLAVDLNPIENPYVGCGATRTKASLKYRDRSRHRKGMVTGKVVAAFGSVGWGWGGSWTGNTQDYMHFSSTGH